LLFSVLLLFLPASAGAIDASLCAEDGVTEVPDFADSRDGNQCLMIDPGNGDPLVPFQYEQFHKTGVAGNPDGGGGCNNKTRLSTTTAIDHNMDQFGRCSTSDDGKFCSLIFWDITFDNYIDPACKNEDGLIYGSGQGWQYMYFKNTVISNTWKCKGGGWSGPNGIFCSEGVTSSSHVDGIQMRGNPANGGWWVFQDSKLVNTNNTSLLYQVQSDYPPNGSVLWQGVEYGQTTSPVGEATNWVADCYDRGTGEETCEDNNGQIGYDAEEIWLVDVSGPGPPGKTLINPKGKHDKLVIVNTGCGPNGCGGSVGYTDGWPHPLLGSGQGPGVCPNGLMLPANCGGDSSPNMKCYCYTSLEAALGDTATSTSNQGDCPSSHCPHEPPPFLQHSAAGWEDPPTSGSPPEPLGPPQRPTLLP